MTTYDDETNTAIEQEPAESHDEYEVGYGKPPKATRFKKGQSGNPKGRPKGAKGFTASLMRELEAGITVREGNRKVKISKGEAAAKRLVAAALNGDMKALGMLARLDNDLSAKVEAAGDAAEFDAPEAVDLDILRHHFTQDAQAMHPLEEPEEDDDNS